MIWTARDVAAPATAASGAEGAAGIDAEVEAVRRRVAGLGRRAGRAHVPKVRSAGARKPPRPPSKVSEKIAGATPTCRCAARVVLPTPSVRFVNCKTRRIRPRPELPPPPDRSRPSPERSGRARAVRMAFADREPGRRRRGGHLIAQGGTRPQVRKRVHDARGRERAADLTFGREIAGRRDAEAGEDRRAGHAVRGEAGADLVVVGRAVVEVPVVVVEREQIDGDLRVDGGPLCRGIELNTKLLIRST